MCQLISTWLLCNIWCDIIWKFEVTKFCLNWNWIQRHDLKSRSLLFILLFFFTLFLWGNRKGKKNNQSRDFQSCLSAGSWNCEDLIMLIKKNHTFEKRNDNLCNFVNGFLFILKSISYLKYIQTISISIWGF